MLRASCGFAKRQDSFWWCRTLLEVIRRATLCGVRTKVTGGSEGECEPYHGNFGGRGMAISRGGVVWIERESMDRRFQVLARSLRRLGS
jgi:hypothetical protein